MIIIIALHIGVFISDEGKNNFTDPPSSSILELKERIMTLLSK